MKQSSKKAKKKISKKLASKKEAMRTATPKSAARKRAAKRISKQRMSVKSTVPPQFRELKQLAAKNDPRFWELRDEFRDYFRSLPEQEVEPFLKGLGRPYLDYLAIALAQESWAKNPVRI